MTGISFSSSLWWLFSLLAWFLGYVSHSALMGTLWNAVIKWPRKAPSSNPSIWLFFLSPRCKGLVILLWGRRPLFAFEGHRGRNLVRETQWSFLPLFQTYSILETTGELSLKNSNSIFLGSTFEHVKQIFCKVILYSSQSVSRQARQLSILFWGKQFTGRCLTTTGN